ncbi:diguanylate cyclase [uncultured Duodenibacillus sp.]|uniref:diguanylate cyclase n=1 Tax=uncultured Duodenibacillus sp. TaxID=1980699 RepID=UPI00338FEE17
MIVNLPQVHDGIAVLMVDIDFFENLNDRCGHQFGDRILHAAAQTPRRYVSKQDTVYRYGGKEHRQPPCLSPIDSAPASARFRAKPALRFPALNPARRSPFRSA